MDLDKRILDGKKPLDCFDTDIAKQFIGKKGLFASHESQFMNLDTCPKCVVDELKEVNNYDDYPFITSGNHCYRLFLPTEWVKETKKKFRPYTMNEFKATFTINTVLTLRKIDKPDDIYQIVYLGCKQYDESDSNENSIYLTIGTYSLKGLLNIYEIYSSDGWKPFGVEE